MNRTSKLIWLAAFVVFGLMDIVTSVIGFYVGAGEGHWIGQAVVQSGGVAAMFGAKMLVLLVALLLFRYADRRYRDAIPGSLAVFGGIIVVNNLAVIQVIIA